MGDAVALSALWAAFVGGVFAVPLAFVLLHALLRPREPAAEARARELNRLLLEEELYGREHCFECGATVQEDWVRCPFCSAQLRERCDGCGGLLKLHWTTCPTCAGAAAPDRALTLAA